MSITLDLGLAVATRGLTVPVVNGFVYVSGREIAGAPVAPAPLSDLVTVVAEIASGGFVVAVEPGQTTVCDGEDLAAVLAPHASAGTDFRLWLRWPEDSAASARLRRNLWELAETTGAVVWSPPEGGQVDVVAGCRDLGCSAAGEPVLWEAYHPRSQRRLRFHADADGRLVPTGGLSFASRQRDDGSFVMHLPVLEDGRLAAFCVGGSRYPLGPRQLYELLDESGWRGQRIMLGDEVGSVQAALLAEYLDVVGAALGQDLPIQVRPLAAHAPEARTRHVASSRPPALAQWCAFADTVGALVTELPSLQLQTRAAVCDSPAGATDLLSAWYDLHRQLVVARHTRAIRAVSAVRSTMDPAVADTALADAALTDADFRDAPAQADALGRARQLLMMHLDATRLAAGMRVAPPDPGAVIDPRWDAHLRMVSNVALAQLDPCDPEQARQMRGLAQAITGLATAPEPGHNDPDSLDHPNVQLRLYIERVTAGAIGDIEPPVAMPASPDEGAELDPYEERFGPDPTQTVEWTRSRVFLARPRLVRTSRQTKPHGLSWLPRAVWVNEQEFDVYVESAWPASRAAESGIPSPRMFLVGHVDPSPAATHEVRVRVARRAAVDVPASGVEPPAALREEVSANDAYVLPAAWLDRCRIVLDNGEIGAPVSMWCSGAAHGIDGLPDTGQAWPRGLRAKVRGYALVPEAGTDVSWVRLYRRPPRAAQGRIVELIVGKRRIIDAVRLSAQLAELPAVRTILPEVRAQGAKLILPRGAFERALAVRVLVSDGGSWVPQPLDRGTNFAAVIQSAAEEPSTESFVDVS